MSITIYPQTPGKYHVWKTVGGYVVVFIVDRTTMRHVDGGKIYKDRQNAYRRAKRLNTALKRALEKTGMAEAEYGSGYIANVQDEQGEFGDKFSLTFRNGGISPFETHFFDTLEELEQYVYETLYQPLNWHKVVPEEVQRLVETESEKHTWAR